MEAGASHRRFAPGIAVTLCGIAPFAVAGLAWESHGGELDGAGLVGGCPMLEVFGIPCAGCGGARAFFHLTHGDPGFLAYNWVWPLAAAFAVAFGALMLSRAARGEEPFGSRVRALRWSVAAHPARTAAIVLVLLATPWLVAFANLDAIRSG
jgi:hypothetical protein